MEHKPEYADNDQTIFRKPKDRDHPYVVISKTVFEDAEISWKAKGMMGYLLSRPDDWTIILGDLVKRAPEGRGTVRTILRELEQHGYLLKRTLRDEHGRWAGVEMIVLEHPAPLEQRTYREKRTASKTPHTEKPHTAEPPTDNCPLLSTDVLPCTDLTKEEPPTADSPPGDNFKIVDADGTTTVVVHLDSPVEDSVSRDGILLPGELPRDQTHTDNIIVTEHRIEGDIEIQWHTPEPSSQEPVEQGKARRRNELGTDPLGVASVVAQNRAAVAHPDGGDPSKDGDPWVDITVKEWARISGKDFKGMSIGTKLKLAELFRKVGAVAESGAVPVGAAIARFPIEHDWWAKKVGFEWPSEKFCNKLGMMLVPDIEPEPQREFTFVDPDWLGAQA